MELVLVKSFMRCVHIYIYVKVIQYVCIYAILLLNAITQLYIHTSTPYIFCKKL